MLCSVVVPLFNKASFIETALRSVLGQRHGELEIVVVDDGSTDDGPSRVRALRDDRIRLIKQPNGGVSRARNRGIELAKGELVCFLDADDWYLPQYLETIVAMAHRFPDIAFFGTGYKCVPARDAAAGRMWEPGTTTHFEVIHDFFHRWRFGHLMNTDCVAVRRKALIRLQPCFAPGLQMGEDLDLWFRLAERHDLVYCPAPLVAYRVQVEGSLCTMREPAYALSPAYAGLERRALEGDMPDAHRASALALVIEERVSVARNLLMAGRRYEALGELLRIRGGLFSRRWLLTLLMCAAASSSAVRCWEDWRQRRTRGW